MKDEIEALLDAIEETNGNLSDATKSRLGLEIDPVKKREIIRRLMGDAAAADFAKLKGIPPR